MAYRKKYKALILKQVPCILKYMPCIFRLFKSLKNNMVENDVFERSAAWQKGENMVVSLGLLRRSEAAFR